AGGVVSYSSLQFQYATQANTFLSAFTMGGAYYLTGTASGPGVYGSLENVSLGGIAESVGSGLVVSGSGVASSIAPFTLSGSSVQFGAGGSIVTESPVGYSSLTDTIALAVVTTSGVLDVTLGGTAGGVRNLAISGVVSGSAGLSLSSTSSSAGLLTLSGNNTYSGVTTVGSGTLQVGAGGTTGSIAGDIVDNATLVFNRSDALTSAGSISGSGSVLKLGAGVLSLTGTNTYSGLTTVSAGTLSFGAGGTTGSITGNIVDNSTLVFNRSNALTYAGSISGSGAVVKQGSGVLTLTGSSSYSGLTTVAGGALNIQNSAALGSSAAGAVVNAGAALELQGGLSVAAESLLLSGSGVSNGGALRNISGTNTYSGAVTLAANSRINSDAGRLVLNSGTIAGAGYGLTVGGAGDTAISSSINTGAGGLTKDGSGRLTLTGSNSYAGLTRVNAGVLNVQNSLALGGTTAGTLVNAFATLELQGGVSVAGEALSISGSGVDGGGALRSVSGTNTFAGPVTLANDSRINTDAGLLILTSSTIGSSPDGLGLTVGGAGDTAIGSSIRLGAGGLIKDGSGTLTISGTSNYTGATAVNAGVLVVTGQLGNTNVNVGGGARLAGDGTILGGVAIGDSGTLSVGSLGGSVYGDLAVGSLMLGGSASTATTLMDIHGSGNQAGTAGINYDSLVVSNPGGLTYGGTLGLNFWNTQTFSDWTVFHLFDFTGTAHEDFESVTSLAAVGNVYGGLIFNGPGVSGAWTADVSNGQSLVFYEATGSLVVVPEPSTIIGAVVGIGLAAWRYRRLRHLKRVKQATQAA
ncbi:MAG: autotransporter-associated beta strand repeat-containing protein, partial [Planctomycetota bacterium]